MTTTDFESEQSDQPDRCLLNLIIALFLCRGRSIRCLLETRLDERESVRRKPSMPNNLNQSGMFD